MVTASQIQHHLVPTLFGFHTLKLKKKIQTRSCQHKALSCRHLGLTIEKDLQAKPVNLPRCAAPWERVLNPSGVKSAKQSPRGNSQTRSTAHISLSVPLMEQNSPQKIWYLLFKIKMHKIVTKASICTQLNWWRNVETTPTDFSPRAITEK